MNTNEQILKYPRTPHLEGSRLQPGDEDLSQVPLSDLWGCSLVVEEKLDGANCGISFHTDGRLLLQSRGHYLTGGAREKHFAPFKAWAAVHQHALYSVLADRYILYGEWLYAKHTVYYDALPHWFMAFDVWDKRAQAFMSKPRRQRFLASLPIASVPVLYNGTIEDASQLLELIGGSRYKTKSWKAALVAQATQQGLDPERVLDQTDPSDDAEGLYIKHEVGGQVVGRYKFVRSGFFQMIQASDEHWLRRPIVPNKLQPGVDIFCAEYP